VPDFATSIERLLTQIHHWDEPRWRVAPKSAPAAGATSPWVRAAAGTRSQLIQDLVQHLADLGAEAEKRPSRPVTHVHDLVLRDQLRVLADDFLAATPPADLLARATSAVDEARKNL
jgi:hypothetical protein